jgi:pyrimidine operon attenuation protein / uracil phosphoribosyltransferase
MNAPSGTRTCLYDTPGLTRVLDHMAQQIAPLLLGRDQVAIIGVLRRGAPLADQLTERLVRQHHLPAPLRLDLKVKRYADDLTLLHPDTQLTETTVQAELNLRDHTLLVVDDVLYTGHSLLRVLEYLRRKQPAAIRVAVLADRLDTRLPVKADVVGAKLEIAPEHIIECNVPPYEPTLRIDLLQPDRTH